MVFFATNVGLMSSLQVFTTAPAINDEWQVIKISLNDSLLMQKVWKSDEWATFPGYIAS